MGKGIFGRLMLTHFVVGTIIIVVVGLLLTQVVSLFIFRQKSSLLTRIGTTVARAVALEGIDRRAPGELVRLAATAGDALGANLVILRRQGDVYLASSRMTLRHPGELLRQEEIQRRVIERGQVVVLRGTLGGQLETPVITVGVPIKESGQVVGGVFLFSPLSELRRSLAEIYQKLIWIALGALALAAILSYWNARRLSQPLRELGTATAAIASGDFSQRVSVATGDELEQLGDSFNRMAGQLQRLEEMRREFVANVSHELRSPLTTIRGFVIGILDGTIPEGDRHRYLSLVDGEIERMSALISDLLELAELQGGDPDQVLKPIRLDDIVGEAVSRFKSSAQDKGIELGLEVTVPSAITDGILGQGPLVRADRDRVAQVMNNLLENALGFTPEGGHVLVGASLSERATGEAPPIGLTWGDGEALAPGMAGIWVSDSGPGVPVSERYHIWERFYRSDRARTRSGQRGGTGLGLSIVKGIVEAHGGSIWVTDSELGGAKFVFTLPLAAPARAGIHKPQDCPCRRS